ncbi:hypothetical protein FB451DRAFT_1563008 [Mycena latifolia]|nr:hypothetical protein FB451DRAFT_1563008 [Mycena latifolia]
MSLLRTFKRGTKLRAHLCDLTLKVHESCFGNKMVVSGDSLESKVRLRRIDQVEVSVLVSVLVLVFEQLLSGSESETCVVSESDRRSAGIECWGMYSTARTMDESAVGQIWASVEYNDVTVYIYSAALYSTTPPLSSSNHHLPLPPPTLNPLVRASTMLGRTSKARRGPTARTSISTDHLSAFRWPPTPASSPTTLRTHNHGLITFAKLLMRHVQELRMADNRRLYTFKCDVLNPLNRRLALAAGPESCLPATECNDPETTLLSWVIYGGLFHHSLELVYLPLPQYKPLSSITRYKWLVYCVPDENSFAYLGIDRPQFMVDHAHSNDDTLSMRTSPSLESGSPSSRKSYISSVMHMGIKSLEVLLSGGPERMREDLDRIAGGMLGAPDEEQLLAFVGDPWLTTVHADLLSDIRFTLWSNWVYPEPAEDSEEYYSMPLERAIGAPPQKKAS